MSTYVIGYYPPAHEQRTPYTVHEFSTAEDAIRWLRDHDQPVLAQDRERMKLSDLSVREILIYEAGGRRAIEAIEDFIARGTRHADALEAARLLFASAAGAVDEPGE